MQNSETTKQAAKQRQARKKGRRKKTTSIFFLLSFFILCVLSTAQASTCLCVCICVGRLTAAAADSSFLRSTCVRAGSCKQQAVSCQWQRGAEGKRKKKRSCFFATWDQGRGRRNLFLKCARPSSCWCPQPSPESPCVESERGSIVKEESPEKEAALRDLLLQTRKQILPWYVIVSWGVI